MTRVILTAQVESTEKWEKHFRTHGELFHNLGVKSPIQFTTVAPNTIAFTSEVADIDKYLELLQSPETIDAMKEDSVIRETVQVFVLDKMVEF